MQVLAAEFEGVLAMYPRERVAHLVGVLLVELVVARTHRDLPQAHDGDIGRAGSNRDWHVLMKERIAETKIVDQLLLTDQVSDRESLRLSLVWIWLNCSWVELIGRINWE